MKTLTVFTPTYNRAYILPQLYMSLCNEECRDFVWMIVDDGSSDNTEQLVSSWISEKKISIIYFKCANGGKMRAHNYAVKQCETPLFICIDSDDQISNGAVDSIVHLYNRIKEEKNTCGLLAKRRMINSTGSAHTPQLSHITLEKLYALGFRGETSLVFKTEILRKYPFLEITGEKFSTEEYAYMQIDREYEYLLIDEFWIECEYQPDGYSLNITNQYFSSPKGWIEFFQLSYRLRSLTLSKKIWTMSMYIFTSIIARISLRNIIKKSPSKVLCLLTLPIGLYVYKQKKRICQRLVNQEKI